MNNDNISFIEVVFENVESIVIPIERIVKMDFGKIEIFEEFPFPNEIAYNSEYLNLEIMYKDESELIYFDDDYDEPLGMYVGNLLSNSVEDRPNILGRLINSYDIVAIELLNNELEQIKMIYIPWSEVDQYINTYMNTEVKDGVLKIKVEQ